MCLAYQIESHMVPVLQGLCGSLEGVEASINKFRDAL